MIRHRLFPIFKNQQGVTMVYVAICIFMLIAFVALAVDIGHLTVTKNELQNAADAGALAAARFLYSDDGTAINTGCNQIGVEAGTANSSDNLPVEVALADVERGHWSFSTNTFTPNSSENVVNISNYDTDQLDTMPEFINAVRVTAKRHDTPVASWFSRIFGYTGFQQSATAVAYVGFIGNQYPLEVDMPIAICKEYAQEDDCSVAREIGGDNWETAAWTDLTACEGGAPSAVDVNQAVIRGCSGDGANQFKLNFGEGLTTNNGQIQGKAMTSFRNCWESATNKTETWLLKLPVIECSPSIAPCNELRGAVLVRVLWVTEGGEGLVTAPEQMAGWGDGVDGVSSWSATGSAEERWASFVDHFDLQDSNGDPAILKKKTIYFRKDCTRHDPSGDTGGENFGIRAVLPVLVD
jgi:hypothetical protein